MIAAEMHPVRRPTSRWMVVTGVGTILSVWGAAGEATRGIAKKGCSVGLCAYALVNLTPPVSRQNKQVEAFESDSSASVDAATLPPAAKRHGFREKTSRAAARRVG